MFSRHSKPLLFVIGFLILTIPLFFARLSLTNIAAQEQEALISDARRILLTEQSDFLRDLDPALFLQSIHDELDRKDGLWNEREGAVRQVEKGRDPHFFTEAFLHKRWKQLEQQYGLSPLYLYVTDTDLLTVWWRACGEMRDRYAADDLEWFGRAHANQSLQATLSPPWLPDSRLRMPAERAKLERQSDPGTIYVKLSEAFFGRYWNKISLLDGCIQGFSEKFNTTIFLCSRFLISSPSRRSSTFGGYGAVFSLATLPKQAILLWALARSRQPGVASRLVTWVPAGAPLGFEQASHGICLKTPIPHDFRSCPPQGAPGFQPILTFTVTSSHLRNLWREAVPLLDGLSIILLVVTMVSGWFWCHTPMRLPLSSRWKLTGITVLAGGLPIAFLGLMSVRLLWLNERDVSRRVLELTQSHVRSIASSLEEQLKIGTLQLQRFKRQCEQFSAGGSEAPQIPFATLINSVKLVKTAFLFRLSGGHLYYPEREADRQLEDVLQPTSRLFFQELGALPKRDQEGSKDLAMADMFDFYWATNRADIGFAQEGMETRSVMSFQEDQRMQFWLLASDSMHVSSVWGVGFVLLHTVDRLVSLLMKQQEDRNTFHLSHPLADIDTWVFQFTYTGGLRGVWPFDGIRARDLPAIISRLILVQKSGSLWTTGTGETRLQVWEKLGDQLVMVAGQARLKPRPLFATHVMLLLGGLGVIALVLNLLMADLLSTLFVAPLRVLSRAVDDVGIGDYTARVTIRSSDELEDVGDAFNRMIEALRQRERLKRFVPAPVVQRLQVGTGASGPAAATSTNNEVEVIILASDIRGFTRLSESIPPDILVPTLNEYFTLMQDAITDAGGRVLKLIGDAILAVFLPTADGRAPALAALQAARSMREQLRRMNEQRRAAGIFLLENGIGLALGPAIPIELGTEHSRREFTLFGTPLTESQYLESLSAHGQHSRIVGSRAFVERLNLLDQCFAIIGDSDDSDTGFEIPEVPN